MKNKLIVTVMLAALLASGLAFFSCKNDPAPLVAFVPAELTGTYDVAGMELVINANGTGTLEGADIFISESNGVLTISMGTETITVEWEADAAGLITFSAPEGADSDLKDFFQEIADAGPVMPDKGGPITGIPAALVGTWGDSYGYTTDLTGATIEDPHYKYTVVFIINADGSGKVVATGTQGLLDCNWTAVAANKIKLTYLTISCTFDWAINASDQLVVSNPDPASSILAGYKDFEPMNKVTVAPPDSGQLAINAVDWVAIGAGNPLIGSWESTSVVSNYGASGAIAQYPAVTAEIITFVITSNPSTHRVNSGVVTNLKACEYKVGNGTDADKFLIIYGDQQCMFTYSIATNVLTISAPVYNSLGAALAGYTTFGPGFNYKDPGQEAINAISWVTIGAGHDLIGSWESTAFSVYKLPEFITFVILEGGSGQLQAGNTAVNLQACEYQVSDDNTKIRLIFFGALQCMFDYSVDGDVLTISSPVANNAGSSLAGYVAFGPSFNLVED